MEKVGTLLLMYKLMVIVPLVDEVIASLLLNLIDLVSFGDFGVCVFYGVIFGTGVDNVKKSWCRVEWLLC